MTKAARYAGLAAVIWLVQMAAAGHAWAWSAMPVSPTGPGRERRSD